ncbi:MAG TPA: hypothetical protein VML75_29035 [Kofleriaceae bacterium]|nr:hypothetical protein [Kofleriaceae bacterium]
MNARTIVSLLLGSALSLGCGGQQNQPSTGNANSLDVAEPAPDAGLVDENGGEPTEPVVDPNAPLVTFELHNSADKDLAFAIDKGWSLVVSGYSGKPPKAKPIILFPTHCTSACEVTKAEGCPVCATPVKAAEEKEAVLREVVAPGATFELGWDGEIHVYEKAKVKGKRCDCFTKKPVEPATYTLRACGLRITTSAKATSKFQCVTSEVTLPPSEPTRIRFDFAAD